jgi:hypothetical protein
VSVELSLWTYTGAASGPHSYSNDHRSSVVDVLVRVVKIKRRLIFFSAQGVPGSCRRHYGRSVVSVKHLFALSFKCVKVEGFPPPRRVCRFGMRVQVAVTSPPPVREAFLVHRTCWVQVLTRPGFGPAPSDCVGCCRRSRPIYPNRIRTKPPSVFFLSQPFRRHFGRSPGCPTSRALIE